METDSSEPRTQIFWCQDPWSFWVCVPPWEMMRCVSKVLFIFAVKCTWTQRRDLVFGLFYLETPIGLMRFLQASLYRFSDYLNFLSCDCTFYPISYAAPHYSNKHFLCCCKSVNLFFPWLHAIQDGCTTISLLAFLQCGIFRLFVVFGFITKLENSSHLWAEFS